MGSDILVACVMGWLSKYSERERGSERKACNDGVVLVGLSQRWCRLVAAGVVVVRGRVWVVEIMRPLGPFAAGEGFPELARVQDQHAMVSAEEMNKPVGNGWLRRHRADMNVSCRQVVLAGTRRVRAEPQMLNSEYSRLNWSAWGRDDSAINYCVRV